MIGEVVKKRIFYNQADRKRLPPPSPPYGQLFVNFFGVLLTLYYDYMCSQTDFAQEKGNFRPTTGIPNSSS